MSYSPVLSPTNIFTAAIAKECMKHAILGGEDENQKAMRRERGIEQFVK